LFVLFVFIFLLFFAIMSKKLKENFFT